MQCIFMHVWSLLCSIFLELVECVISSVLVGFLCDVKAFEIFGVIEGFFVGKDYIFRVRL